MSAPLFELVSETAMMYSSQQQVGLLLIWDTSSHQLFRDLVSTSIHQMKVDEN